MANKIDEIARIWLTFVFQNAAEQASDEKTKDWIKAVMPLDDNEETSLIVRLLSGYDIDERDDIGHEDERTKMIERRIEQLNFFRKFNEELISMYENELKVLKCEY
jgi:hypothetical protein